MIGVRGVNMIGMRGVNMIGVRGVNMIGVRGVNMIGASPITTILRRDSASLVHKWSSAQKSYAHPCGEATATL